MSQTLSSTATILDLAREAVISARGSLDHVQGRGGLRAAAARCKAAAAQLTQPLSSRLWALGAVLAAIAELMEVGALSGVVAELKPAARELTWQAEAELRRLEGGLP